MGKFPRLDGVSGHKRLELLYILLPQYLIKASVKTGVTLLKFSFVHKKTGKRYKVLGIRERTLSYVVSSSLSL